MTTLCQEARRLGTKQHRLLVLVEERLHADLLGSVQALVLLLEIQPFELGTCLRRQPLSRDLPELLVTEGGKLLEGLL